MNGEQCLEQAYQYLLAGDFEAAEEWFLKAVETNPDEPSYIYRASITLARNGKLGEALSFAGRAVELAPEEPAFVLHLRTLESKKLLAGAKSLLLHVPPEAEEAIPMLREAARLDPLSGEVKLLLAVAYRYAGDYRLALATLRELVELQPQNEEAKRILRETRQERRLSIKQIYTSNNHTKDW
ncbi:tetratricopeptide repeat protein [Cohnella sp. AR92]|uniref:tetratricopeptide repeat protein n=1 Tax=Cohnella sp. AR92 TaxID=648716 RepID=UPI0013152005|nr:tetratricopeptide repeat protein [Cohnella sp. AR92]